MPLCTFTPNDLRLNLTIIIFFLPFCHLLLFWSPSNWPLRWIVFFFFSYYIFILMEAALHDSNVRTQTTALHMPLQSSHIKIRLQKTFRKDAVDVVLTSYVGKTKRLKNATVCNHDINKTTQSKLTEMCKRQNQNSKWIKQKNHRFVTLSSTQLLILFLRMILL